MKKLCGMLYLIFILMLHHTYAQMDEERTKDQGMLNQGQTMEQEEIMSIITGLTEDMSAMLRRLSLIMGDISDMNSHVSRERLNKMSGIMKSMASDINRISEAMVMGEAREEDMQAIKKRLGRMNESILDLRK